MFLRGYLLLDSSDMSMTWSNFLKSIFVWKCVFKNVILGKSVNATSTKHKREGACLKLLAYVDSILNIQIRSIKVICSMLLLYKLYQTNLYTELGGFQPVGVRSQGAIGFVLGTFPDAFHDLGMVPELRPPIEGCG